jgi:hypothetical protein
VSHFDDNFEGYYDDDDDDECAFGSGDGIAECKFCGRGNLAWEDTDGGWVLVDRHTREVHRCRTKAASDDDFTAS